MLDQYPDEAWGLDPCVYTWSSPRRGSQSMVDSCPSTKGRLTEWSKVEGESSRASAINSRQLAVVVALVTRPICPNTVCSCFLVQLAMSGRSAVIAAWSHCPAQRRAIRVGWLCRVSSDWNLRPRVSIGPGGRRLTAIVRSKEPPIREPEVLGHSQRTCACVQNL